MESETGGKDTTRGVRVLDRMLQRGGGGYSVPLIVVGETFPGAHWLYLF